MLKWVTLLVLLGLALGHPGVYDEYSYNEDGEEGGDGDYYLYYDEDESAEPDIDDEELKKITDLIADYSYEEDKPQKGRAAKGGKGQKKNKQRPARSAEEGQAVDVANRKALKKHRLAAEAAAKAAVEAAKNVAKSRSKRFLDSFRLDKLILPVIKEVFKSHPRPLTKEQRDKISGGFFGWQYAVQSEDCCSCKPDNTCSCCPSTNITGSDCIKFAAQPNRAQVSIDIGKHRHMEITVAKNSRSTSCEHANLKDICIYSDSFTPSENGYKACVIVTNNVKDPKEGILKCINYSDGQTTISDK